MELTEITILKIVQIYYYNLQLTKAIDIIYKSIYYYVFDG